MFQIKMTSLIPAITLAVLVISPPSLDSARILGVLPHVGKSHFFVFEPYMKALASLGHDVTVISHFPQRVPLKNYRDISIAGVDSMFKPINSVNFDMFRKSSIDVISNVISSLTLGEFGRITCESSLSHPSVQELLKSDEKFDLVITELFMSDCFLGFVHKYQAPHIALSSCILLPWANNRFGNPHHPAYIPNFMGSYSDRLTFLERLENTFYYMYSEFVYYFTQYKPSQRIANKYFGVSLPSILEIAKNTSLILVNSYPVLNKPRPMVPAVIEIGGIHLTTPKKLPKELDKWMSDAKEGVIFFSMGSMLRAETLPEDKLRSLLAAFRELPQRVLWKWEGDTLPGQPDNVRIGKWLPQHDILNHPNVRLFISHCGLLSSIETANAGVPIVGSPIYGDQMNNFYSLKDAGVAVKLNFQSRFTKDDVLAAIRTVLNNQTYAENAKRLSRQYLDRPSSPMETAIFWTEYVIRHKGAQHLRSAAVDLPWYQYLLLDVILVLLAGLVSVTLLVIFVIKRICRLCRRNSKKTKQQ